MVMIMLKQGIVVIPYLIIVLKWVAQAHRRC